MPAPSADTLYSNGLRDIQSGKYDLARSEFQDYLKHYGNTDLASNAQFYLGEIAYKQKNYQQAITEYDKVLNNYPKSFKLASALLHRGTALIELGQKSSAIRDLREVVRQERAAKVGADPEVDLLCGARADRRRGIRWRRFPRSFICAICVMRRAPMGSAGCCPRWR